MEHQSIADIVYKAIRNRAVSYSGVLQADTCIGDGGIGLDSLGCLELVLELERLTGLRLRSEQLTAEALATIGGLICYLESLRSH